MQRIHHIVSGFIIAGLFCYACKKEIRYKADFNTTEDNALLRIVDAAPSFRDITGARDTFHVYIDGVRVTTSTLSYSSVVPNNATNPYIAVPAGVHDIRLSIPGSASNPDSVTIYTTTKNMNAGEQYTFMITDSLKSARDSSQMWVQDKFNQPTAGYYNFRFIHAVLNDTSGKKIDVYSTRRNGNIVSNVAPGTITNFQQLPYNPQLSDTLYIRRAGTTFNLVSTILILSASHQRTYTVYYRGDGNLTTGAKARGVAAYVH